MAHPPEAATLQHALADHLQDAIAGGRGVCDRDAVADAYDAMAGATCAAAAYGIMCEERDCARVAMAVLGLGDALGADGAVLPPPTPFSQSSPMRAIATALVEEMEAPEAPAVSRPAPRLTKRTAGMPPPPAPPDVEDAKATRPNAYPGMRPLPVTHDPHVCHHCGITHIPADQRCVECGIQAHKACCDFDAARCPACVACVPESDPCAICNQCEILDMAPGHQFRMLKVPLYHGAGWTRMATSAEEMEAQGRVRCSAEFDVAKSYTPCELPERGRRPMFYEDPNEPGTCVLSTARGVHTTCAALLTQSYDFTGDYPARIMAAMEKKTALEHGSNGRPHERATFETHACVLCGERTGWTTFCWYHMHRTEGGSCRTCEVGTEWPARRYTRLAFHASCATRCGFYRMAKVDKDGLVSCGVMCCKNKMVIDCPKREGGSNEVLTCTRIAPSAPTPRAVDGSAALAKTLSTSARKRSASELIELTWDDFDVMTGPDDNPQLTAAMARYITRPEDGSQHHAGCVAASDPPSTCPV